MMNTAIASTLNNANSASVTETPSPADLLMFLANLEGP